MGQLPVTALIGFPARFDTRFILAHPLLPPRKMSGQGNLVLVFGGKRLLDELRIAITTGFEAVNFPAQPRLPAIDASCIQEDRATYLTVRLVGISHFENEARIKA